MAENPFDRLARFYEWEHGGYLDDLPLYLGLAGRVGGPILEAACGSGRLLLPLARAGETLLARSIEAGYGEKDLGAMMNVLRAKT